MPKKPQPAPLAVAKSALGAIARYPANGNSEPDVMAAALAFMDKAAHRALKQIERAERKGSHTVVLTPKERDTVLAAVRLWQAWVNPVNTAYSFGFQVRVPDELTNHLLEIADNWRGGTGRISDKALYTLARKLGGA